MNAGRKGRGWFSAIHAQISRVLYDYDPDGMGSTVHAPLDEYDDVATSLLRALSSAGDSADLGTVVLEVIPGASKELVQTVLALWADSRSAGETQPRYRDPAHFRSTHERWLAERSRKQESSDYLDSWWEQQCGMCTFWIPLSGEFSGDYGVCSNPASPFDGKARVEHDGCEEHETATS